MGVGVSAACEMGRLTCISEAQKKENEEIRGRRRDRIGSGRI
jgi:hypothetical protein